MIQAALSIAAFLFLIWDDGSKWFKMQGNQVVNSEGGLGIPK